MADTLSQAQERLMKLVNNTELAQLVGSTLAEIAVELMDAKQEAHHWKQSFETVRDEIKVLAATVIKQRGTERLVITKAEYAAVPTNTELWLDTPEPGVRIYELRQRVNGVSGAVGHILRPN
jgi:hypothetical protein